MTNLNWNDLFLFFLLIGTYAYFFYVWKKSAIDATLKWCIDHSIEVAIQHAIVCNIGRPSHVKLIANEGGKLYFYEFIIYLKFFTGWSEPVIKTKYAYLD